MRVPHIPRSKLIKKTCIWVLYCGKTVGIERVEELGTPEGFQDVRRMKLRKLF